MQTINKLPPHLIKTEVEDETFAPDPIILSAPDYLYNWSIGGSVEDYLTAGYDYPKYDANGREFAYFVEEEELSGFTTTYDNNEGVQDGTITVYNRAETTAFEFSKVWKDISQQPESWPTGKTITVTLNAYTDSLTKQPVLQDIELTFAPENLPTGWTTEVSADGKITTFKTAGLDAYTTDGTLLTYYIVESQVKGYKKPAYAGHDGGSLINADRALNGQRIVNSPEDGIELPSTGGPGTRIYTILGSILALVAGALLIKGRKFI